MKSVVLFATNDCWKYWMFNTFNLQFEAYNMEKVQKNANAAAKLLEEMWVESRTEYICLLAVNIYGIWNQHWLIFHFIFVWIYFIFIQFRLTTFPGEAELWNEVQSLTASLQATPSDEKTEFKKSMPCHDFRILKLK